MIPIPIEQGRVVREGKGAATRYRLAELEPVPVYDDRRWMVALAVVRRDGRVTRGTLASAAGVSERTATRVLGAMVEAGVLVEDGGRGRGAGYGASR